MSWNLGVEHLLGYEETEWLGQPGHIIFTPEDRTARIPEKELDNARRHGRASDIRWHQKKGGSRLFVEVTMMALRDSTGELLGYSKVMRDITLRKRAEEVLRQSEERFRTLFTSIDQGFCIIEVLFDALGHAYDYRFLETSPNFEKHTGLTGIVGKTVRELLPDHEAHWFEIYGNIALTGVPARVENRARALGRFYDVYAFRIGEPEQRQVAVLFSDITERKNAEMRATFLVQLDDATRPLSDSHEIMQTVARLLGEHLEADSVAYCDVEPDEETFTITGDYTRPGMPSLVGRYTLGSFGAAAAGCLRANEPFVVEDVENDPRIADSRAIFRQAGICADLGVPLHRAGRLVAAMAVHQRMPRQWRPEEIELVRLVANRCWESIERTRVTRQLRQKNEELTRVNRGLEEFAHVASHDLQEPLRTVHSYGQLLARSLGHSLTGEQKEFLDFIQKGARRMEQLIRDLLAYSRVVHTAGETLVTEASLDEALRRALTAIETRALETGANIIHEPLPTVQGDLTQLSHVFQNLLSNALKYHKPDEPPQVQISARRQDGKWVVSVRDNGIGFEPDQSQRIFELFRRLHREDEYAGTGLGLAICKRIIERYGGRMWAESEPGVGSTFFFSLAAVRQ